MKQALKWIGSDTPIHMSFDIDSLDSRVGPKYMVSSIWWLISKGRQMYCRTSVSIWEACRSPLAGNKPAD